MEPPACTCDWLAARVLANVLIPPPEASLPVEHDEVVAAMSASRPKRSWSTRSRSAFRQSSLSRPWVSIPSPDAPASTDAVDTSSLKDAALLRSTRRLLSDAEGLFSVDTPLNDPRVRHIRRAVEGALPRLYALHDNGAAHPHLRAVLVTNIAEEFLRKFPDPANSDFLRLTHTHLDPVQQTRNTSPNTPTDRIPPARLSPLLPQLSQSPSLHNSAPCLSHPHTTAPSVLTSPLVHSAAISSPALPSLHAYQSQQLPSPLPSVAVGPYVSGPPQTPLQTPTESQLKTAPLPVQEAIKRTSSDQQMVFFAVHDLLWKSSIAGFRRQPWYEPPICLSPQELMGGEAQQRSPAHFGHHNFSGLQVAGYPQRQALVPQSGSPYAAPHYVNRSISVNHSLRRESSTQ